MWLAQIPSWPPCFQVGYFSLCIFSGYLPQKQMPSKDIQDCLWWAPLPSDVSAAQNTLGSWSSFTQENKKKTMPKPPKGSFPGKFLHHLCHYVVIVVLNEMDCQISLTHLRSPPYTRYGLKLPAHPQKKNDQTSHRFSGFVEARNPAKFGEPWVH